MSVTQSSPYPRQSKVIPLASCLTYYWCQSATRLVSSLTAARPLHETMAFNSTNCWLKTIAVAMIVVWNPIQPQPYSFSFSRPTTRTIVANSSRRHSLVVSTAECEISFSIMHYEWNLYGQSLVNRHTKKRSSDVCQADGSETFFLQSYMHINGLTVGVRVQMIQRVEHVKWMQCLLTFTVTLVISLRKWFTQRGN